MSWFLKNCFRTRFVVRTPPVLNHFDTSCPYMSQRSLNKWWLPLIFYRATNKSILNQKFLFSHAPLELLWKLHSSELTPILPFLALRSSFLLVSKYCIEVRLSKRIFKIRKKDENCMALFKTQHLSIRRQHSNQNWFQLNMSGFVNN